MLGKVGGLVAAALILLGSFLPWATVSSAFGSVSVKGTEGDGVLTLLLALALAVLFGVWKRGTAIAAVVLGAIVVMTAVYDLVDLASVADKLDGFGDISPGAGLIMVLLGGLAATGCAVLGITSLGKRPAFGGPTPYGQLAQPYGQTFGQAPAQAYAPGYGQQPGGFGPGAGYGPGTGYGPAPTGFGQPSVESDGRIPLFTEGQRITRLGAEDFSQTYTTPAAQPGPGAPGGMPGVPTGQPGQPAAVPAGWHPDPYGKAPLRYWDGTGWTEHVHGGGSA